MIKEVLAFVFLDGISVSIVVVLIFGETDVEFLKNKIFDGVLAVLFPL